MIKRIAKIISGICFVIIAFSIPVVAFEVDVEELYRALSVVIGMFAIIFFFCVGTILIYGGVNDDNEY